MVASSTCLSCEPKVRIANSFSPAGTRSTTAAPDDDQGRGRRGDDPRHQLPHAERQPRAEDARERTGPPAVPPRSAGWRALPRVRGCPHAPAFGAGAPADGSGTGAEGSGTVPCRSASATRGASARNAAPRWLIAFFSSAVCSARVRSRAVGHEDRVVAEPAAPRWARWPARRAARPCRTAPAPPGQGQRGRADEARRRGARRGRRRSGRAAAPGWRRRRRAGPAQRAEKIPGRPAQDVDARCRSRRRSRAGRWPRRPRGPSAARCRRR